MSPRKRKTLPKDFAEQLTTKSIDELKAIFETTEITATRFDKSAIAFPECPDELTRWLVGQGLSVEAGNNVGWSALACRAGHAGASLGVLLELGANVDGRNGGHGGVPLIFAAARRNLEHVKFLLDHGANPFALSSFHPPGGRNALETAVNECNRRHIDEALPIVEYLVGLKDESARGPRRLIPGRRDRPLYPVTDEIRRLVTEHGHSLERLRFAVASSADPAEGADEVARFDAGVRRLYELFNVPAVPPIPLVTTHDGVSPIQVVGDSVDAQYTALWRILVPRSGPATTVQGEVIRLVGRLRREIEGNGGINWDQDFRLMQDALAAHLSDGNAVPGPLLAQVRSVLAASRNGDIANQDFSVLDEAAVAWVRANPEPVPLPPPGYDR